MMGTRGIAGRIDNGEGLSRGPARRISSPPNGLLSDSVISDITLRIRERNTLESITGTLYAPIRISPESRRPRTSRNLPAQNTSPPELQSFEELGNTVFQHLVLQRAGGTDSNTQDQNAWRSPLDSFLQEGVWTDNEVGIDEVERVVLVWSLVPSVAIMEVTKVREQEAEGDDAASEESSSTDPEIVATRRNS
ncbi:hypothetical protein G7Y89_g2202 [Cudoniella acicularis]|uniref:Uncharacterized protein n=1 Tax=Cudoniella acicularis TaxID=354080 RepID=A0A8H4W9J6_9HELO|nr:hypothetical protein G7Y89_g2202 [Cudoniella acicularis]